MAAKKTLTGQYWKQQKGESDKAFEAFQLYESLGTERTLQKVADKLTETRPLTPKSAFALVKGWASDWQWTERIRAHNNWLVAEDDKQKKQEVKARYERIAKISDHMAKMISVRLLAMTDDEMKKLSHSEVMGYARTLAQLAGESKDVLIQSEKEVVQIEVAKRRLDLDYMRLEASQSATAPTTEQGGSNFEEALKATVPDVWSEHEQGKEENDEHKDNSTASD